MFPTVDLEPTTPKLLFDPGQAKATLGAQRAMRSHGVDHRDLMARHLRGDWNRNMSAEVVAATHQAINSGRSFYTSYDLDSFTTVYLITDENREYTTYMLLEELAAKIEAEKVLLTGPTAVKAHKRLPKRQPGA